MSLFQRLSDGFRSLINSLIGEESLSSSSNITQRRFRSVAEMLRSLKIPYDSTDELKAKGWKVKVRHLRYFDFLSNAFDNPVYLTKYQFAEEYGKDHYMYSTEVCPFGGKTECVLVSPEGKEYSGVSTCSLDDNFSRRVGRAYAVSRAYEKYLEETGVAEFVESSKEGENV